VRKAFFITGGTRGIGAAIALRAAAAGDHAFVTGRDEDRLRRFLGENRGLAGCVADAADWGETEAAVAAARERYGQIDVVVPNAGVGAPGDIAGGDPEAWRTMVLTNVLGVSLTVKACLPSLRESRGRIVLIGSVTGRKNPPGSLYSATKWAATGLAESLRLEVREAGIGVTIVHPGVVDTDYWPSADAFPFPLEQPLSPDDVARAVLFAVDQPPHVDVNEILLRPKGQPL
jgi:NADP-dependent 3-hydroxy acid dehydrogenase YdfG